MPIISEQKKNSIEKMELLKKQEEERIAREAKQGEAILGCSSISQVIELYTTEKGNKISVDKCSTRAYELCSTEVDYELVVQAFGETSLGGKLAKKQIVAIETERLEQEKKKCQRLKKIMIIAIAIIVLIGSYFIWGLNGLSVSCIAIAVISSIYSFMNLGKDEPVGCSTIIVGFIVAILFGFFGYKCFDLSNKNKQEQESIKLYEQIKINPTIDQCIEYIGEYGATKNADGVRDVMLGLLVDSAKVYNYGSIESIQSDSTSSKKTPLFVLVEFAEDNKDRECGSKARRYIYDICDSLYKLAYKEGTLAAWQSFQEATPSNYWRDSNEKIQKLKNKYLEQRLDNGCKPYSAYYGNPTTGENYLSFKTSGDCDYVVIVKNHRDQKVYNHIYIRGDQSGKVYLPNGTFDVYFYSGKGWDPEKNNGNVIGGFVAEESFQKDNPIELNNSYCEYTLYPVVYGNLKLDKTNKSETF